MHRNQRQRQEKSGGPHWLKVFNSLGLGLGLGLTIAAKLTILALADAPSPTPSLIWQDYPLLGTYDLGPPPY
jgi:hypothetical protein